MSKTYAVLGGGGSFGIHTSLYLLDNLDPKKVIGIGRNNLRSEPFSLGIERRKGYEYHARHLTYELDLLLELLDKEKPEYKLFRTEGHPNGLYYQRLALELIDHFERNPLKK